MYWKLLFVTLAVALVVSATPLADWPMGGAPPPVADDTSSGSNPRPSHPGLNGRQMMMVLAGLILDRRGVTSSRLETQRRDTKAAFGE
ncbi:hypothetical protein IW261DRAFT_1533270 [Armillaria novae-zelandiae]|uniref:Uncharacterized protein n=1 Tax=Armillaria novae-zelandiae TaxID=153914 RepID=A0AA39TJ48_9AGAR|nr:hypothetical protein IW261DRAFT_1533270 [Armillaria novae-zelandiae]